jgi:hypothetical protein
MYNLTTVYCKYDLDAESLPCSDEMFPHHQGDAFIAGHLYEHRFYNSMPSKN